jgi:16S rRNA C967 or C1407 C5-methylase (RsmB/RsmF family)
LEDHLPTDLQASVHVTGHDATRWGLYEQNVYDRILLDAPCSSERHVLNDPKALAQWSPSRTRTLAQQAIALLCSALEALRPGGWLLYSTCSISPHENEQVLEKFRLKRPGKWSLLDQATILPDEHTGAGPLFWALLQKETASG